MRSSKNNVPDANKRKKKRGNGLMMILLVILCMGLGFLIGKSGIIQVPEGEGTATFLKSFVLQMLLLLLAYYVQIVLHEGGHLIAGLLTGYRFSSFRIGSLMLLKTSRGYSFKRYSLAGTGGQCLLIPPEKKADGSYPYKLYHLGGVLMNLITAAAFFALYYFSSEKNLCAEFCAFLAITGIIIAITNGIPMRVGGIATDGYNVLHVGKEPAALEAMWLQLKVNQMQTEGIRLKDLPAEWFVIPEHAAKNNEIIASLAVFEENRAMDALEFSRAKALIAALEKGGEYEIIGLYKNLLLLDKITIDLMERGAAADTSGLDDPQMKSLRKAMAKFPSVIRTEYAIQLLKEKNAAGAQKYRELFDKISASYPNPSDIASEKEIMRCLEDAAQRAEC